MRKDYKKGIHIINALINSNARIDINVYSNFKAEKLHYYWYKEAIEDLRKESNEEEEEKKMKDAQSVLEIAIRERGIKLDDNLPASVHVYNALVEGSEEPKCSEPFGSLKNIKKAYLENEHHHICSCQYCGVPFR